MGELFVGTSGWSYRHWYGRVYPRGLNPGEWLSYYAQKFNTVEVNSTFYRLPRKDLVKGWYEKTPKDFLFALKISRFISHLKRLKSIHREWKNFLELKKWLKGKTGPFLLQLPPSFDFSEENLERLKHFLNRATKTHPLIAVEFRHPSWSRSETFALLKRYNSALCIADGPKDRIPLIEKETADFIYLRFHGRERLYASNYSKAELR
ncbi:DUF72 domain-containing protein, partial [bacterium]|nr:DUF72 domain-containing protein [bacterium]